MVLRLLRIVCCAINSCHLAVSGPILCPNVRIVPQMQIWAEKVCHDSNRWYEGTCSESAEICLWIGTWKEGRPRQWEQITER